MKASFESRDLSPQFGVEERHTTEKEYKGAERRKRQRRVLEDRRQEVRFDLNPNRRQNPGRRKEDNIVYR